MEEYRPNSHRSRELVEKRDGKKFEKVISGSAKTKKKNAVSRFSDVFVSGDVSKIKEYVIMDILVPGVKKGISEIIDYTKDTILYGEPGHSKKPSKYPYRNCYERERDRRRPARRAYDYEDVVLDTRGEAEDVLYRMDEIVGTYGFVSIGDLYDLVGIDGNHTDNKYGWTNILSAKVVRVGDGYIIKLPRPMPLD